MVTDVVLPLISGRELAELVERMHPTIRVLYVSGYAENTIVHHGILQAGRNPLPTETLYSLPASHKSKTNLRRGNRTMKIVLAVDPEGSYQPALEWLKALRFQQAEIALLSVVEPLRPSLIGVVVPFPPEVLAHTAETMEQSARTRLEQIRHELAPLAISITTEVLHGYASTQVLDYAEQFGAHLIALGGSRKRSLEAFFVGSVMRAALTNATQSLLIAYSPPPADKPLHAVYATDHSEYNARCADMLVTFAPQGLKRIAVATAVELDEETFKLITQANPALAETGTEWIIEHLHERNRAVCEKFRTLNVGCESVVVEGPSIPSIRAVLEETDSSLLLLGAKGHSLLERLSLGSVSYHFAAAERTNLLILRV